jgi:hypothetical protein
MKQCFHRLFAHALVTGASFIALGNHHCFAGGVTVITHGFELGSTFPSWVSEMADQIRSHPSFPGTNFTDYRIIVTYNNGYGITWSRVNGGPPSVTDSGEIIVELDWSQLSGDVFDSYASTFAVAWPVTWALLQTNLIPEMNGHALVEGPIHLIGHSRGGSLMSEVSRLLGTNSIWVDHLTTLDPYPLNNDGNTDFPATVVDAPVRTYSNVLFADNYWQNLGAGYLLGDPDGEPVSGAYVRGLTSLSGGYNNDHENVHLWYYGTVDNTTPASDGSASITSAERQSWWVNYEQQGTIAGFAYSLIGGHNRLSNDQPLGPAYPAISSGFNQWWDFGAGTSNNRTVLSSNSGQWPNIIKLNVTGTNVVTPGDSVAARFYYQYAGLASNVNCQIYFDGGFNPYGSNSLLNSRYALTNTGAGSVYIRNVSLSTSNTPPGTYAVYALISDPGHARYLYAPERVQVLPSQQQPSLELAALTPSQIEIGVNGASGQTVVLQESTDLRNWLSFATNTLSAGRWIHTNNSPANFSAQFFRALIYP